MPTDRRTRLTDLVEAFDEHMAPVKELEKKVGSGGKEPGSFFPFIERDENQRLTAFRLALAEVFGEK